ncbi:hypothetical protein CPS_1755 [Colwellia psychrerythraea 34H]|uniref:Uncharacterized protein n=1 Tax=Colwellia psychrerythraea (strain 34H / ATCC BAA-681) TaxID=167879 RepID=Q484M9_COLP3|nr:hypothetical protein CPS_1755 [Colwellia psychrerythraea 34H]
MNNFHSYLRPIGVLSFMALIIGFFTAIVLENLY